MQWDWEQRHTCDSVPERESIPACLPYLLPIPSVEQAVFLCPVLNIGLTSGRTYSGSPSENQRTGSALNCDATRAGSGKQTSAGNVQNSRPATSWLLSVYRREPLEGRKEERIITPSGNVSLSERVCQEVIHFG